MAILLLLWAMPMVSARDPVAPPRSPRPSHPPRLIETTSSARPLQALQWSSSTQSPLIEQDTGPIAFKMPSKPTTNSITPITPSATGSASETTRFQQEPAPPRTVPEPEATKETSSPSSASSSLVEQRLANGYFPSTSPSVLSAFPTGCC